MINIAFAENVKLLGHILPLLSKQWNNISLNSITNSIWEIFTEIKKGNIQHINMVLIHIHCLSFKELYGIKHFHDNYPHIKIIGVSGQPDSYLIRLSVSMGASAYCCLNDNENILEHTIHETFKNGRVINKYVKEEFFQEDFDPFAISLILGGKNISNIEAQLLSLIPTDLTYKQIADMVNLSPKTIDRHREILFQKLNIKTRQGLALFAVKHGLYEIK